jgi:flagellar basal body-associated protein FliL
MVLLKILFITICVLWLLKMVARLLLPMFFHKMMAKAQSQANQRYQQRHNHTPDGRIRVDYMPPKEKTRGDDAGDFVDYEDVK